MSSESSFKANCGPDVEFISTRLFDHDQRRCFSFLAHGKLSAVGLKVATGSEDDHGRVAGQRARAWAEGYARMRTPIWQAKLAEVGRR